MAKNKIKRIDQEIAKVREKITEYQDKLKPLEAQKTEAENLEIIQTVRALRLTPEQLSAMLSGGTVPGMAAASADGALRLRFRRHLGAYPGTHQGEVHNI